MAVSFQSTELRRSLGWCAVAAAAAVLLLLAWAAVALLNCAWWLPRRLERTLRAQGLRGSAYRFLRGDIVEDVQLRAEAHSKPIPLLLHDIVPRASPLFHRAVELFGTPCFTWFGPVPRVIIKDPELMREIISNKFGHLVRPKLHPLLKLVSTGVFSYDGEKWVKHRRILSPAFHSEKLKRLLPAFSACCTDLVSRWENLVGPQGSFELDVLPELQKFTGDVISRAAFGSSYEEGGRIFQLQNQLGELVLHAVQTKYVPGYRFLPTPTNRRMKAMAQEIRTLLRGIVKKRDEAIKKGETSNNDLLGLLMDSNMKHLQENGNKNTGMTTEEVIDECKLFYFAGEESTSTLLTWTMVVLSMHPNWQVRAREEVLQVFGKRIPDLEGLNHLKVVTMILYEILRLYPPFPFIHRRALKAVKIGNILYPPGVVFLMSLITMHHDEHFWGKDANEFKPERFAEGISKASSEQVAFLPFGGGPRICIGQNFALLEAKVALSMILQRFTFELSPSYTHAPQVALTLLPQYGAPLRLHRL